MHPLRAKKNTLFVVPDLEDLKGHRCWLFIDENKGISALAHQNWDALNCQYPVCDPLHFNNRNLCWSLTSKGYTAKTRFMLSNWLSDMQDSVRWTPKKIPSISRKDSESWRCKKNYSKRGYLKRMPKMKRGKGIIVIDDHFYLYHRGNISNFILPHELNFQ